MTNIDLDALQALAVEAAQHAPGEWKHSPWHIEEGEDAVRCSGLQLVASGTGSAIAYIAAANPQTILSLIARIRELEGGAGKSAEADRNVEDLRDMLRQRSAVGLKKYGVTTCRNPLELRNWLQHALEETLDNAVYLRQAQRMLDVEGGKEGGE